jgi:hypothetical protein
MGAPGGDGSMLGGLSSMMGLSGMGGMLGLGGMGAGVSGMLAAPLFGQGALTSATDAALGSMGGAFGPAAPSQLGLGGATVGGAIGGIGGGFMIGSTVGGMVAGRHEHRRTNANVGAGIGATAGFLVGGPVGGLIGGALGGAVGGMIGPRSGPGFFNLGVETNADGMLVAGNAGQKRAGEQLAALQQQTAQQIQALNQQMAALGLRASGRVDLGANVRGATQIGSLAEVTTQLRLMANDARIQGAIDRAGGGTFGGQFAAAQDAASFAQQLDAMRRAAEDAADPIGAIRRQFDTMRDAAQRLGFGLDEVNAAQDRAIKQAEDQRRQAATGLIGGIADYARTLRVANDNAGNPMSRLSAAESQFSATISAALSGDARALGRVQADAEAFRGLSREVFGTGQGLASAEDRIVGALEQLGGLREQDIVVSAIDAQTTTLAGELRRLISEVEALRRDARQAGANPLAARAA